MSGSYRLDQHPSCYFHLFCSIEEKRLGLGSMSGGEEREGIMQFFKSMGHCCGRGEWARGRFLSSSIQRLSK